GAGRKRGSVSRGARVTSGAGRVTNGHNRARVSRLEGRKAYKLLVGGAFVRTESGRAYPAVDANGRFLAHVPLVSRKDVRDAVKAARGAFAGWSGKTAYNRGQVLYRAAEMLEERRAEFVDALVRSPSVSR